MREIAKKLVASLMLLLFSMTLIPSFEVEAATTTPLGNRLVVGYWHNFTNPAGFKKLSEVPNEWDVINVSFGITNTNDRATIIFEPEYNEAEFIKDVKDLQSKGKKVLLSLGGETGIVKVENMAAEDRYVNSVSSIIDKYGFDGLDIDLEGGSGVSIGAGDKDFKNPQSPLLVNLIEGTRRICDKYGSNFMLTMAPETLYVQGGFSSYGGTAGGYLPIIYALRDKLTYIHVQDYNTGGMLGLDGQNYTAGNADFHVAMTEMLLTGFPVAGNTNNMFPALDAEQVMFGVPSCSSAAGSGYTSNAELEKALNYLMKGESFGGRYKLKNESGYSDLRGIMTWSITWDITQGNSFAKFFRNYFDNLKIPEKTLKSANISANDPFNGKFTLNISVPERNTAKTYTIVENGKDVATGELTVGSSKVQNIPYKFTSKAEGTYKYKVILTDKDGKTVTSNEITVNVPKKTEASSLPDRIMVGYWHNFKNGAGVIKLRDVSPDWDVINVSFGETFGDKAVVELHPVYDEEEFIDDIAYLQSKGKKVVLSLGGAEGTIKIPTDADQVKFIKSVTGLIDKYGFDGIDIDLEGGSGMILQSGDTDFKNPKTPQIVNFIKSIKELDKIYGRDFIISMAPELSYVQGGIIGYANNWGAYLPLIHGVREELDYLQVQHYNSGGNRGLDGVSYPEGSADFHVSMIDMLLQGFPIADNPNNMFPPLRQDQVVIGIPSSPPAAGSGYTKPQDMKNALNYLIKGESFGGQYKMIGAKYPELRGMMTWSINWDVVNNSEFIKNYRPYFDALPPISDSLKKAQLSASEVVNKGYTLTAKIPSRNTAVSYRILEGTTEIEKGTLQAPSKEDKVITKVMSNKAYGTYNYTVELKDAKGTTVTSELVVEVLDPTDDPNKEDVNKDGKIDIQDLAMIASKYNVKTGDNSYDIKYDLNRDNIVDLFDLVRVAKKFEEKAPEPEVPEWSPTKDYTMNDVVMYQGKKYQSKAWWSVGVVPGTNINIWLPID